MPPAEHLVLGVETCTREPAVALVIGTTLASVRSLDPALSPSRQLLPLIEELLVEAGCKPPDLSGLAVAVGPGSFTGARLGLATMQALASALGRPLTGVSTLAAVVASVRDTPGTATARECLPVTAWIDAGRGEIYAAFSLPQAHPGRGEPVRGEAVLRPEVALAALPAQPIHFAGSGVQLHRLLITGRSGASAADVIDDRILVLAPAVARLGAVALQSGTPLPAVPRYLRPPDATRAR